jgi:hypothetical protein
MNINQQTQLDKIKAALLSGCRVDSVSAFSQGITRLSAIIKRLRDRGYPVITERDHNNGLARYRLPEDWQPSSAQTTNPIEIGKYSC